MKKYTEKDIKASYLNFFFDGIVILDILYGIDDYVVTADCFNGNILSCIRKNKIYTAASGRNYIKKHHRKYFLDEFLRR